MTNRSIRQRIAEEAARLIVQGKVADSATARKRAARWLSRQRLSAADIPTHAEILDEVLARRGVLSRERDPAAQREARRKALALCEALADFEPTVIGTLIDGVVTRGADLMILVAPREPGQVLASLAAATGLVPERTTLADLPPGEFVYHGSQPVPWVVHGTDERPVEGWSLEELRQRVELDNDFLDLSEDGEPTMEELHEIYRSLLEPLERVKLDPVDHPEGDALFHVLQVFALGREALPYDEEFLLACLLHDVGQAIDPRQAHECGLEVLQGIVTPRTWNLIAALPQAHDYLRGVRAARGMRKSEDFEEQLLLARCDRAGRQPGYPAPSLDEALEFLLELHHECEGDDGGDDLDDY
ncbi:MAG: hypothetical protein KF777_07510 [Planctomycetaceae bacterium]|nr:hypothetical protein [Planctomycetaceae bacterium]